MSGGQHRNDGVNGPSRSGEVKRKDSINRESKSTIRNCADTRVCLGKQKTETKRS